MKRTLIFIIVLQIVVCLASSCLNSSASSVPNKPDAASIKPEYWADEWVERLNGGNMYKLKIQRIETWDRDEESPNHSHRGPLKDANGDELAAFMFVKTRGLPSCNELISKVQEMRAALLIDILVSKYDVDRAYAEKEMDDDNCYQALSKEAVYDAENFFQGYTPEEKEDYFKRRMPVELQKKIWEAVEDEDYINGLKDIYGDQELLEYMKPRTDAIKMEVEGIEKKLNEKGFTVLWDINDAEWKDTLTWAEAVCVAMGTKDQIFELSDELLDEKSPYGLYYALKEPRTTEKLIENYRIEY